GETAGGGGGGDAAAHAAWARSVRSFTADCRVSWSCAGTLATLAIVRRWRSLAVAAAPHESPASSRVATWSLSPARVRASGAGSFGASAACRPPEPHPARTRAALHAESQTAGQRLRQPCIEDLLLRALHRVLNAMEAGAVVVEVEHGVGGAGLALLEVCPRVGRQHLPRPLGGDGGVGAEVREVDAARHPEVVVPYEADRRRLRHRRAALVRPRPVADEVAKAPDRVRRVAAEF